MLVHADPISHTVSQVWLEQDASPPFQLIRVKVLRPVLVAFQSSVSESTFSRSNQEVCRTSFPSAPLKHWPTKTAVESENSFQLTVKPKVCCPFSPRCWEPTSGDGWMGFLALDTAVWYTPEKVPSLPTLDTCILEPRSFFHQPVRLHVSIFLVLFHG